MEGESERVHASLDERGRSIDYLLEGRVESRKRRRTRARNNPECFSRGENRVAFNPQVRPENCLYEWYSFKIKRDINLPGFHVSLG